MGDWPTKILLASDNSKDAALAARAAVDISEKTGSELHVVHTWQVPIPPAYTRYPLPSNPPYWYEQEAGDLLTAQVNRIEEAGGTVVEAHLRKGRPAEEIVGLAEELRADLIVVGNSELGAVKRLVVGSVSEGVVRLASRPVLVIKKGAWPPNRIVVGEDLSEEAKKASELAASLGRVLEARVLLMLAYQRLPETLREEGLTALATDEEVRCRAEEALQQLSAGLEGEFGQRPETRMTAGDPAKAIQEAAEESEEPTLVAVGRRGLGSIRRFTLGSVSMDVLRAVNGVVLIVPDSWVRRHPLRERWPCFLPRPSTRKQIGRSILSGLAMRTGLLPSI